MIITVPQECIEYTQVFMTIRIETVITLLIGLAIGYYLGKRGEK